MVNITNLEGAQIYENYLNEYSVTQNRQGVPVIIIGSQTMVGASEIPERMPGIVSDGLAAGGLDWPVLTGLPEYLASDQAEFFDPFNPKSMTVQERFALDPVANTIAVVVLLGLMFSVFQMGAAYSNRKMVVKKWPVWVIPLLIVVGLVVAGYMTYIEVTSTEAVCGPVGDCNSVQQSEYAKIFGIPVGVIGLFGYFLLILSWLGYFFGNEIQKAKMAKAMWWLSLGGVLFSIYLTFLEPFVIGASCAWCLTSAIVMGLMLWAATPLVKETMQPARRKIQKRK